MGYFAFWAKLGKRFYVRANFFWCDGERPTVPCWNVGPEGDYPEVFRGFCWSLQANRTKY